MHVLNIRLLSPCAAFLCSHLWTTVQERSDHISLKTVAVVQLSHLAFSRLCESEDRNPAVFISNISLLNGLKNKLIKAHTQNTTHFQGHFYNSMLHIIRLKYFVTQPQQYNVYSKMRSCKIIYFSRQVSAKVHEVFSLDASRQPKLWKWLVPWLNLFESLMQSNRLQWKLTLDTHRYIILCRSTEPVQRKTPDTYNLNGN